MQHIWIIGMFSICLAEIDGLGAQVGICICAVTVPLFAYFLEKLN